MENSIHKGTELNNVRETWEQNERLREKGNVTGTEGNTSNEAAPRNELEQLIKQEASEYDNENKENRVLGGDRATVNDEPGDNASNE
jgi:hypothetical protein